MVRIPAFQAGGSGSNPDARIHHGELAEWLNAAVLKTAGGRNVLRGFESLTLHNIHRGVAQMEERRSPKPCLLHVRIVSPLFIMMRSGAVVSSLGS